MEKLDIKYFEIEELGTWPIYLNDMDAINEGQQKLSLHYERERNSTIAKKAKERFKIRNNGKLFCEVCKFDFSEKYGVLGLGFIEAHHKKPISQMEQNDVTKVDDFIMVCSNCHSMLHKSKNCISPEELASLLRK